MDRRRLIPGLVALGLPFALAGGIALAADITCHRPVGRNWDAPTCKGTPQADTITGSSRRDNVVARDGDDTVAGGGGMDYIQGEAGADNLDGGPNPDFIVGGPDGDTLTGGPGADFLGDFDEDGAVETMDGGDGDDWLEDGGGGDDQLDGGAGNDLVDGGEGDDTLDGGAGNDKLFGWTGDDTLDGGDDADLMEGNHGSDQLNGGGGDDFIDAAVKESPGSIDIITCGAGDDDEVIANVSDQVAADCEHVSDPRVPDPTSEPSAAQRRGGGRRAGPGAGAVLGPARSAVARHVGVASRGRGGPPVGRRAQEDRQP